MNKIFCDTCDKEVDCNYKIQIRTNKMGRFTRKWEFHDFCTSCYRAFLMHIKKDASDYIESK